MNADSITLYCHSMEDVRRGMNIIRDHLKCIDASLCYTSQNFKPEEWTDQAVNEKTLSEIAIETGDGIQGGCQKFNDMINQLLNEVTIGSSFSRC